MKLFKIPVSSGGIGKTFGFEEAPYPRWRIDQVVVEFATCFVDIEVDCRTASDDNHDHPIKRVKFCSKENKNEKPKPIPQTVDFHKA